MAKKNIDEKEVTLKWYMAEDKIVKFEELEETFDISEAVAGFDFEKAGIKKGSRLCVKIDSDLGSHGTVVFLSKNKDQNKTTPPSDSDDKNVQVKTVKAYGEKYDGSLLFVEEKEWYSLDKSIGKDNISQYKNKSVEITVTVSSKGKKIIKSIKLAGGQSNSSSGSSKTKNDYTSNNNSVQTSIEAQACTNYANILVAGLFAGKFDANKSEDGELVKKLIDGIARKNWEIVQELKKSA